MILLRVLILVGIVALVWMLWRRLRGKAVPDQPQDAFERMVPCAVCATHIPADRAIRHAGKIYCEQHAPNAD